MAKQEPQHHFADGSKVYLTSDDHFNHSNILKFCQRPFKSVEEMNEALIANWNNKVPEDGIVFHLGDFAWGPISQWRPIVERLNGKIILIKGNHDIKNIKSQAQFDELFEHSTMQMMIEVEGRKCYLNHYPFLCYAGTYRQDEQLVFQAFGHVHQRKNDTSADSSRLEMLFPTQYDVGVDNNDYTPISWYEFDAIIKKQIVENKIIYKGIHDD